MIDGLPKNIPQQINHQKQTQAFQNKISVEIRLKEGSLWESIFFTHVCHVSWEEVMTEIKYDVSNSKNTSIDNGCDDTTLIKELA